MTLVGSPDQWVGFIDPLIPDILDLVISTWQKIPPLAADAHEDPTTEQLCRELRKNRNSGNLPFRIDIQMIELDPAARQNQGRMDITFSPMVLREDIYFCLECKRLNVLNNGRVRSLATEYVVNGMMRFIRGQYAAKVQHGGMLGYVIDGNSNKAIQSVGRAVKARYKDLEMEPPGSILVSSIRPKEPRIRETQHTRQHDPRKFCIHHFFVPAN